MRKFVDLVTKNATYGYYFVGVLLGRLGVGMSEHHSGGGDSSGAPIGNGAGDCGSA